MDWKDGGSGHSLIFGTIPVIFMGGLRKSQNILSQKGWYTALDPSPSLLAHHSDALMFRSTIVILGSKANDGMPVQGYRTLNDVCGSKVESELSRKN